MSLQTVHVTHDDFALYYTPTVHELEGVIWRDVHEGTHMVEFRVRMPTSVYQLLDDEDLRRFNWHMERVVDDHVYLRSLRNRQFLK